ncbi:16S rRNA (cytosine(1402)-N(4))-methyltransferase RsmH [Patescibacteria group bacterium]|nr:16S rRNA (cytosine(1402)-N(4))-methyltransferase RsmH [Patescibacteria group bacterium]
MNDSPAASRVSEVPGQHEPVLLDEVLTHLTSIFDRHPKSHVVDATLGLGGHAAALLERAPRVQLVGLDRDAASLKLAAEHLKPFGDRVQLVHANFAGLDTVLPDGFAPVQAIIADLGISSWQLSERGFSFQTDRPLDFRMDISEGDTAADLVNGLPEAELADLIYQYGEERRSRRIAKAIVTARKQERIGTTTQLADVVEGAVPRRGRLNPATKTFQALRIAVNDELGSLERGLTAAEQVLKPGGRIAVITFHSLEDRIVKRHVKDSEQLTAVNKKVIVPSRQEIRRNPRSRSAKLRVAERI